MSEVTLKIEVPTDLRGVASPDTGLRYSNVLVTPGIVDGTPCDAWLTATNGRIACAVPASADKIGSLNEVMPTAMACKAAKGKATVVLNGEWRREETAPRGTVKVSVAKASEERPRHPALHEVLPIVTNEYRSLTLHAADLLALAKALNADGSTVTLLINVGEDKEWDAAADAWTDSQTCVKPVAVIGDNGIGAVSPVAQSIDKSYRKAMVQTVEKYNAWRQQYKIARYRAGEAEPKPAS